MYDINTKPYASAFKKELERFAKETTGVYFSDEELIPDENKCDMAYETAKGCDYILAVGSGTLNDMAKSVSMRLGISCGVLATAASMDGYCSNVAALMRKGMKVTDQAHTPSDILIDAKIIIQAPRIMTAAGFGDILGKYTCLTDWKLANIVKGESIHEGAYVLMEEARSACMAAFDELVAQKEEGVEKLMNALIVSGLSIAECGNSRPASGSEHHVSHYLEMDFARRGERIPLHGIKVALGTLLSIEIYNYIKDNKIAFKGAEKVYELVEMLPSIESVKEMLIKMGCPIRFSEIGVRRETMEETIEKAYTVRERYTVLTLVNELGLTEQIKPVLMEKYY